MLRSGKIKCSICKIYRPKQCIGYKYICMICDHINRCKKFK